MARQRSFTDWRSSLFYCMGKSERSKPMKRMWALRPAQWLRQQTVGATDDAIGPLVNRIAWPVVIENLLQTTLGVVDVILVGALGAAALAGVGAAIQVLWVIQSAFTAVTTGTTVLVAHAIGAGNKAEANRILKQSLMIGVFLAVIVGFFGSTFSEQIIVLIGGEPDVVAAGATYFHIGAVTAIFMLFMLIVGAALRGAGDSKTPMVVSLWTNVINAILAWALIFGNLGLPAMGVAGSAWATGIARAIGALAMLVMLLRGDGRLSLDWFSSWRPDMRLLNRTLRIGVPSMLEMLMQSGGMLIYGTFALRLGTEVFAAQRITLNAISYAFMPAWGYGMAATALTGQSLGAKNPERATRATWYAVRSALSLISVVALCMFVFSPWIVRIFTRDETLIRIAADALKVIAFSQPFHAIGQVLAGSLRGAGDTRFAMYATGGAIWFVRLPLVYLLGPVMQLSLAHIYIANIADAAVRLVFLVHRFRRGEWQKMRV